MLVLGVDNINGLAPVGTHMQLMTAGQVSVLQLTQACNCCHAGPHIEKKQVSLPRGCSTAGSSLDALVQHAG